MASSAPPKKRLTGVLIVALMSIEWSGASGIAGFALICRHHAWASAGSPDWLSEVVGFEWMPWRSVHLRYCMETTELLTAI